MMIGECRAIVEVYPLYCAIDSARIHCALDNYYMHDMILRKLEHYMI